MKRKKKDPPKMYLCISPNCSEPCMEDKTCEIDWENKGKEIYERLKHWHGPLPDKGCPKCGWPVILLPTVVKDIAKAMRAGIDGIHRAYGATTAAWRSAGLRIVFDVACRKKFPISSDLYPWINHIEHLNDGKPVDKRSIAGLMTTAESLGWIRKTGAAARSEIEGQHAGTRMEWESLLLGD